MFTYGIKKEHIDLNCKINELHAKVAFNFKAVTEKYGVGPTMPLNFSVSLFFFVTWHSSR